MSSESNSNMKNLEKILDNIPDNVKELFMNMTKKDDSEDNFKSSNSESILSSFKDSDGIFNFESLMHIKKIFDKVDKGRDDKIELIRALKPFLRPSRQNKVLHCIKALRLSKICNEAISFTKNGRVKEAKGD